MLVSDAGAPADARALLIDLLSPEPAPAPLSAALARAAARARAQGLVALELGIQAPAPVHELVNLHAAIALQAVRHGRPAAPTVIVSGATALRDGQPVEPADWLLALALALDAHPAVSAGARSWPEQGDAPLSAWFLAPDTLARLRRLGPAQTRAGAAAQFERLGDAVPGMVHPTFLSAILLMPY